ncbi:MAG: sugar phosphate isomerase/epimerase [Acidobacteria bacterium]|nr:sugar phosphate isomerase/epimerase [Acidobacteriota bacterium]
MKTVAVQTSYLTAEETERLPGIRSGSGLEWILEWRHPAVLEMGKCPQAARDVERWLDVASSSSISLLRVVAGYPSFRGQEPVDLQQRCLAPLMREICSEAARRGITIGIENHANFTPLELLELIERVGAANLRAIFDTGNCVRLGADPVLSARTLAPVTVAVHLKDLVVLPASVGNPLGPWPSAPLGRGSLDIRGVISTLFSAGFDGCFLLELSPLHTDWTDEGQVIEESLCWLRSLYASNSASLRRL